MIYDLWLFSLQKTKETVPVRPKAGVVAAVFNEDSEVSFLSVNVILFFQLMKTYTCKYGQVS